MAIRMIGVESTDPEIPDLVVAATTATNGEVIAGTVTDKLVAPPGLKATFPFTVVQPSGDTTGATDAAVLNAASVTGKTIRLAPGTFYINAAIACLSNQHWQGADKDVTTVYIVSSTNPVAAFTAVTRSNVTISDLTIDGNKAGNTAGHGINFTTPTDCTVTRCRIKNTETVGIYASLGTNLAITDCDLVDIGASNTSNGTHAAIGVSTVNTRIIGNRIDGCSDSGIISIGDGHTVIADNHVEDCFFIGIGLGAGHAATGGPHTISGNTVKTTAGNSIDTGTACNVTITGNSCIDGFSGIDVDISSIARSLCNIAITGNTVRDMAASGIEVIGNQTNGHSGFTIVGNSIADVGFHGIHVSAMHDGTVANNTIADVSGASAGWGFIRLHGGTTPGCVDLTVTGNVMNDDAARNSYGISSSGTANDFITFAHNDLRNCWGKLDGTYGAGCIFDANMPRVRETIWIPTSQIDPFVGAAIAAIQFTAAWMFDQTTLEYVRTNVEFPVGWENATLDFYWSQEAAGTGNVLWFCNNEHCAAGGSLTTGGTLWTFSGAVAAPAQRVLKVTSASNSVAVVPGDLYNMWFGRNAPDASDTLANDAGIVGIMFRESS